MTNDNKSRMYGSSDLPAKAGATSVVVTQRRSDLSAVEVQRLKALYPDSDADNLVGDCSVQLTYTPKV